jgi:hypothetical protein
MYIRACDECNTNYIAEQKYLNRGQGRFCSRQCSSRANGRLFVSRGRTPNTICSFCYAPFYKAPSYKAKAKKKILFCSRSCQVQHTDKFGKRKAKRPCTLCSKPHAGLTGFCKPCQTENTYKAWIKKWLSGNPIYTQTSQTSIHPYIRKYLFQKHNSSCQECGWSKTHPTTGKVPLAVDHINGHWWENNERNLRLLCPNCHSLTPTYGNLNKGNGRPSRRNHKNNYSTNSTSSLLRS